MVKSSASFDGTPPSTCKTADHYFKGRVPQTNDIYVTSPPEFIHPLSALLDYAIYIRSSHVIVVVPLLLTLIVFVLLRTFAKYTSGPTSHSQQILAPIPNGLLLPAKIEKDLFLTAHVLEHQN